MKTWNEMNIDEQTKFVTNEVMGWELADEYWISALGDGSIVAHVNDWSPVDDISDAWVVLRVFVEKGYDVTVFSSNGIWTCGIKGFTDGRHTKANTEEEAICLAALAMHGIEFK